MYATPADLLARFGADELLQLAAHAEAPVSAALLELAVAGGNTGAYPPGEVAAAAAAVARLEEACADAAADIDPYLQARYALPLASVPAVLVRVACDVARYYLYTIEATDVVEARFRAAQAFLRDVSAGRASLGLDAAQQAEPTQGGVLRAGSEPRFTVEGLRGYTQ